MRHVPEFMAFYIEQEAMDKCKEFGCSCPHWETGTHRIQLVYRPNQTKRSEGFGIRCRPTDWQEREECPFRCPQAEDYFWEKLNRVNDPIEEILFEDESTLKDIEFWKGKAP
jgi:hypothetical protein